jgi:mono/diheme cytochrome c family protein
MSGMNLKSDLTTSFWAQSHLSCPLIKTCSAPSDMACGKLGMVLYVLLILLALHLNCSLSLAEDDNAFTKNAQVFSTIDGRKIYQKLCAECHGLDAVPPKGIPELLNAKMKAFNNPLVFEDKSTDEIRQAVSEGHKNMPRYKTQLSTEQITAVVNYLIDFGTNNSSAE